jgi:predicted metal-dependent hydrolase
MQEYLLIKQENEYLMEARPVLADMWDMHAEHIMEHRSVMADPDLRQDPNLT